MPKQVWKIERFDGGMNTASDPRDIADNELVEARDIMVDHVGKIRALGAGEAVGYSTADHGHVEPGYGLFYMSHDMVGAQDKLQISGVHDGSTHSTIMTDSGESFVTDQLIGGTIYNNTDGSSGRITANDGTTITVASLTGGTDNDWDTNDKYTVTPPDTGDDYLFTPEADSSAYIKCFSRSRGNNISGSVVDLGTVDPLKAIFYSMDGILTICDAGFQHSNQPKQYGYIHRHSFCPTAEQISDGETNMTRAKVADNALGIYDGWYGNSITLAKPTAGIYGSIVNYTDDTHPSTPAEYTEYPSDTASAFARVAALFSTTYAADAGNSTHYVCTDSGTVIGAGHARICRSASSSYLRTVTSNAANGWTGDEIRLYPPAGAGWNIYVKPNGSGNWPAGKYWIGITFIYEGNQESEVYDLKSFGAYGAAGDVELTAGVSLDVGVNAQAPFDESIVGGRAYIRKRDTDNPWVLLLDIDIVRGARTDLTSEYTPWNHDDSSDGQTSDADLQAPNAKYVWVGGDSDMTVSYPLQIKDPSPWTYDAINGYKPDEPVAIGNSGQGWKTAVVANRQVYIGNVKRADKYGIVRTEGDAMYKSMPGKPQTFPIGRKIEVSTKDGDEIIRLEEYADRILQFKKGKMHLINISQDSEFLEDTFMHKGVSHPSAVCKTDFGIAWVNNLGCYLYDGQSVKNLLEKNNRPIIKIKSTSNNDSWEEFADLTPHIGYIPKKRQLLVVEDIGATGTGKIWLFDMITSSWIRGGNNSFADANNSNLAVDWNNDLIWVYQINSRIRKWVDSPVDQTDADIVTKDIDFGQPAIRKKIYRVRISYKGDASGLTIKYSVNGDNNTFYQFQGTLNGAPTGSADPSPLENKSGDTSVWHHAELKPETSSEANNIYSFQLHMTDSIAADFEINDISIIYRTKNIK